MISIIAALTPNHVLGKDNKLLWHIQEDLKNFKNITTGNTVIMGRKTFQSIGKPLPNRNNIVISSNLSLTTGITICPNLSKALETAKSFHKETFIIGGASIYEQALPLADKLHLTHLKKEYDGDVYFPKFKNEEWGIEQEQEYPEFTFRIYRRKT